MRAVPLLFALSLAIFSATSAAHALSGLNECGSGILPPVGLRCGAQELLLGYRDAAGACIWTCCPPNNDGRTYNCSGEGVPSDFKLDLRSVRPESWKGVFTPDPSFVRPDTSQ